MATFIYPVDGTSARMPDCSRYRNENEHITASRRATAPNLTVIHAGAGAKAAARKAAHARHSTDGRYLVESLLFDFDVKGAIDDVRSGKILGSTRLQAKLWQKIAFMGTGCSMAIAALYFGCL